MEQIAEVDGIEVCAQQVGPTLVVSATNTGKYISHFRAVRAGGALDFESLSGLHRHEELIVLAREVFRRRPQLAEVYISAGVRDLSLAQARQIAAAVAPE